MAAPNNLFEISSQPGVKRDGTSLDSRNYNDAQWVRFQRGRPRKMGGYRSVTQMATGPFRGLMTDARSGVYTAHTMSPWGIQRIQFDSSGAGGAIYDRTPSSYSHNELNTFTSDILWSSFGSTYAALMVASTPDISDIASDTGGGCYYGDITASSALQLMLDADGVTPLSVSGGLVVVSPFVFVYGSNGLIRNSNANAITGSAGWAAGGSNLSVTENVGGSKIVKGLPMRGGTSAPAALFWALDALYRVTFVGGTNIWKYDTVSASTSVMSKNGIIEYDGVYYWAGVDRFMTYSGVVQELPNQMNANWFFDNINISQRQKVWAMKVPRFGEIWWFFPKGSATECDHAVIYNVREQSWYDVALQRSAGMQAEIFPYPMMAGSEDQLTTSGITFTAGSGTMKVGDTLTGSISGATGSIVRIIGSTMNLNTVSVSPFTSGETITNQSGNTATINSILGSQIIAPVWQHEFGKDKVNGQNVDAIDAWFQTSNLDFASGGPMQAVAPQQGVDINTRVLRIEPDFVQVGSMNVYAVGQKYANSAPILGPAHSFDPTVEKIDIKEQYRLLSLRFESNVLNGDFQMGKILGTFLPGDVHG